MPFQNAFAQLFTQNAAIASVVFCLVVAALGGAVLLSRRRRRQGRPPSRRATADRLEIGYATLLVAIVAFLVATGFMANARDFADPGPAVAVRVTGYQWCWRFAYEGTQVTVDGQCVGGKPPVLVVPAGEPVRFDVTSADVLHAFWVPYLRAKMYAYPGHTNSFTVTVPRPGQWVGRCAQLCGLYHYDMDFYIRAVPPAVFRTFLRTAPR